MTRQKITVLLTETAFTIPRGESQKCFEARSGKHFRCGTDREATIADIVSLVRKDDPTTPVNLPIIVRKTP